MRVPSLLWMPWLCEALGIIPRMRLTGAPDVTSGGCARPRHFRWDHTYSMAADGCSQVILSGGWFGDAEWCSALQDETR